MRLFRPTSFQLQRQILPALDVFISLDRKKPLRLGSTSQSSDKGVIVLKKTHRYGCSIFKCGHCDTTTTRNNWRFQTQPLFSGLTLLQVELVTTVFHTKLNACSPFLSSPSEQIKLVQCKNSRHSCWLVGYTVKIIILLQTALPSLSRLLQPLNLHSANQITKEAPILWWKCSWWYKKKDFYSPSPVSISWLAIQQARLPSPL